MTNRSESKGLLGRADCGRAELRLGRLRLTGRAAGKDTASHAEWVRVRTGGHAHVYAWNGTGPCGSRDAHALTQTSVEANGPDPGEDSGIVVFGD